MFLRLLLGSLVRRRDRALLCLASLTTACGLTATLLHLALDSEAKATRELRAYGANLTVLPRGAAAGASGVGPEARLRREDGEAVAARLGGQAIAISGVRYFVGASGERPAVIGGIDLQALPALFPYWQLEAGEWPRNADECVLGTRLADLLRTRVGQTVTLGGPAGRRSFRVAAIVRAGDATDSQAMVSLDGAAALTGDRSLTMILATVTGRAAEVAAVARAIEAELPHVRTAVARPLAAAEAALVPRLRGLMAAVSVVVLVVAGLTAGATLAGAALDRQREIALMKALGAEDVRVARLFLVEALLLGAAAGAIGAAIGLGGAHLLMRSLFGLAATFRPTVIPITLVLGVVAAMAAAWLPAVRIARLEPAVALRGE